MYYAVEIRVIIILDCAIIAIFLCIVNWDILYWIVKITGSPQNEFHSCCR